MKSKEIIGHGKKTGLFMEFKKGIYVITIFDAKNPKDNKSMKINSKNLKLPRKIRDSTANMYDSLRV